MPRGYRLFFAAALGCIALAALFGWRLQPEEPKLTSDRSYGEQSTSYRAGGSNCEPAKIRAIPVGLRQRKADACAEAEEQHREAVGSLIEARRAAIAANAQAVFAQKQTGIAAWGFGVGIVTLLAAVAAAVFAERAAFHTKASHEAYRSREEAELLPMLKATPYQVQGFAKNVGPTKAVMLVCNSALFPDPPPNPVPFLFPGHGRMGVAIEGGKSYEFGNFNPLPGPVFYYIGGIIYQTVFGDVKLMRAAFRIDLQKVEWTVYEDLDWSLWEAETEKKQQQTKRFD